MIELSYASVALSLMYPILELLCANVVSSLYCSMLYSLHDPAPDRFANTNGFILGSYRTLLLEALRCKAGRKSMHHLARKQNNVPGPQQR